jgi:hypothetical protein
MPLYHLYGHSIITRERFDEGCFANWNSMIVNLTLLKKGHIDSYSLFLGKKKLTFGVNS